MSAQETTEPIAFLLTAPKYVTGVDWLDPNVIVHWTARYRVDDVELDLLYSTDVIPGAAQWPLSACRLLPIRVSPDGRYFYTSGPWSLIVSFPLDNTNPGDLACSFVDRFVQRFRFFLNLQEDLGDSESRAPPFPAVLELS